MIDRSTLVHLRFPFSFFLAPIAMFGLSEAGGALDPVRASAIFVVLHGLLYPASNGFNSYYDRDEGSIGGIEHPPRVTRYLLVWSLLLDGVAVAAAAALVSARFALVVGVFGLLSKAYSWPPIRLKRRPVFSWLGIGLVQGAAVFAAAALDGGTAGAGPAPLALVSGAVAVSLFYLAGYPLTQIYQHGEDARRGDRTISMICGVRGTFVLSAALFTLSAAAFVAHYAMVRGEPWRAGVFVACQAPLVLYFLNWARLAWRNPAAADFGHAMGMNLLSAVVMNGFFVGMMWRSPP